MVLLDNDDNGQIDTSYSFGANGMADTAETAPESGVMTYAVVDTDGDGTDDVRDLDSDNDGLHDVDEARHVDADDNGRLDSSLASDGMAGDYGAVSGAGGIPPNADGDAVADFRDLDSDNDGITDIIEAGGADSDGDGAVDGFTDADGDGYDDTAAADPLVSPDTDGDGVADVYDLDSDNDGVLDIVENGSVDSNGDGTVDGFTDADGDGYEDSQADQPLTMRDRDGDGIPDTQELDSDGDGEFDIAEAGLTDENGDGIIDNFVDTDGDGRMDVTPGTGALGSGIVKTQLKGGSAGLLSLLGLGLALFSRKRKTTKIQSTTSRDDV